MAIDSGYEYLRLPCIIIKKGIRCCGRVGVCLFQHGVWGKKPTLLWGKKPSRGLFTPSSY